MRQLTVAIDARLAAKQSTGDTSYWRGLLDGLAKLNLPAKFLLFSNTPPPPEVPLSSQFNWEFVPGKIERYWSLVTFPLAAKRAHADVIHTQYNVSPLSGSRAVTTIHDVSFFVNREWFPPKVTAVMQAALPRSAARAARILTVSEHSKQEIEQFIPQARGKVVVTPNALGSTITPFDANQARELVASRLGINSPYIFTIGSAWKRKNLDLAFATSKSLQSTFPHTLAVSGRPENVPDRPNVKATGYVDDSLMSALYSGASLFLLPSLHEGFGIPLLEAFACSCPVLCGNGGALPEVAGDAAIIAPDYNEETWLRLASEILTDSGKVSEMARRGLIRVQAYNWEETARLTWQVYEEVARDRA
ncbi:glycosyltransferase family 1 protein [Kamptonema cortianum]|nr:glycosyltransferase family 1 protein [Kamptonema cortianum]